MTAADRLTLAAFHAERVASRKLAARLSIPEPDALLLILTEKAGAIGIDALLVQREEEKRRLEEQREARRARHLAAAEKRAGMRQADPGRWNAWFDGSARPNPGACSIGAVLAGPAGERVEISQDAGYGSSSEAEYGALLAVLKAAVAAGACDLVVHGDSRVVIDDVTAPPAGAAPSLAHLRDEAQRLSVMLGSVTFCWIPRHRNHIADQLAQKGHR